MADVYFISPAAIVWREGEPFSAAYEDIYFTRRAGLDESCYVFLQHNGLPRRWQGREVFTIAETGFGTGLNFLLTWQAWREGAAISQRLHYVSVERHPLSRDDLVCALALWPALRELSDVLLLQYPPLLRGVHRISFDHGRVNLTLMFGDACEMLPQLRATVDAWYLDGFDPARNPGMWNEDVYAQVARLTAPGGTFATFTAAGAVRRGLQAAGFVVEKDKGFGAKREMLHGHLPQATDRNEPAPWYALPPGRPPGTALVIGAGLAGAACARSLVRRGWQVTVVERHERCGAGASGNPAGAYYPALTAAPGLYGRFYLTAFLHAAREFARMKEAGADFLCGQGVLLLDQDEKQQVRHQAIVRALGNAGEIAHAVTAAQADDLCGAQVGSGGLFFPQAGWLRPAALCAALLAEAGAPVRYGMEVRSMAMHEGGWRLGTTGGEMRADIVVIAAGERAGSFALSAWLPLGVARGQVTLAPGTEASHRLRCALCHDGYVLPAVDGRHVIGATYAAGDDDLCVRVEDRIGNLARARRHVPAFMAGLGPTLACDDRVGLRATTPDQLPVVGPMPDNEGFMRDYAGLHHGRRPQTYPAAPHLPGLYVCAGLGSRGITSALLCAELLGAEISGEPLLLERDLVDALNPARFLVRELRRKRG